MVGQCNSWMQSLDGMRTMRLAMRTLTELHFFTYQILIRHYTLLNLIALPKGTLHHDFQVLKCIHQIHASAIYLVCIISKQRTL